MATIGIHPKLKKETWLYGCLQRRLGYMVVQGQFDHLIPPGKQARVRATPCLPPSPPFNGGGAAA